MDDYSDDGFDDIDANVLQQLEDRATQAHTYPAPQASAYDLEFEDEDLDDAIVFDGLAQQPFGPALPAEFPSVRAPHERIVPGIVARQHQSPSPPPPQHLPPTQSQLELLRPPPPPISHGFPASASQLAQQGSQQTGAGNHTNIISALQARVHALEAELTSARGEVSIVRSKYDKSQASHDAEIARLKKQNADQLAKQERLVEAAVAAEKTATTELHFTRQDLREELGRAKSKKTDGPATPKKNRAFGAADGFDDIELLSSPSKGRAEKSKNAGPVAVPLAERTPTKGKRKRPIVDSPVQALETHEEDVVMVDKAPAAAPKGGQEPADPKPISLPVDFLTVALGHASGRGQPLTFDLFSRYAFPSKPAQTFAAIIFDKLPYLGSRDDQMHLMIDFCDLILDMWSQCLREKYYRPIYHLVSLITLALNLNTMRVGPHLISTLVPVAQTTCCLLAIPRFNSPNGDLSNHPDPTIKQLYQEIDVTGTLTLLYTVALAASACRPSYYLEPPHDPPQVQFWKLMHLEFVLVMLSPKQPRSDFLAMLSLLCESSMDESIGPIPGPATATASSNPEIARTVDTVARALIERVSFYLDGPPPWASRASERHFEARIAALRVLQAFARWDFGAAQLARHDSAILRLVVVLFEAMDALYDADEPLVFSPLPKGRSPSAWAREDASDGVAEPGLDAELGTAGGDRQVEPESLGTGTLVNEGDDANVDLDSHGEVEAGGNNKLVHDADPEAAGNGKPTSRDRSIPKDGKLAPSVMAKSDGGANGDGNGDQANHGHDKAMQDAYPGLDAGRGMASDYASTEPDSRSPGSEPSDRRYVETQWKPGRPILLRIVRLATDLLHYLITAEQTSEAANVQAKLAGWVVRGQYIEALARLNYAPEHTVLLKGVETRTIEQAHELLEQFLTPEEAEDVRRVWDPRPEEISSRRRGT